jgi:hypothetical protein
MILKKGDYIIMAIFRAYDATTEVSGESVVSLVEGTGVWAASAKRMLSENGIADPKPGQWYSQQAYLNGFKTVAQKTGPAVLRNIGRSIPDRAKWPPEVNTVEAGLNSINVAYHMNHRKGKAGNYTFTKINSKSAIMVCDNPYPDNFDYGLIESVAKKFCKAGDNVTVKIDEKKPQRDKGAESTTYIIEW